MDWPGMAAEGIRGIPEGHRINGWYIGLGLLAVVVLTYARKVLRGLDPRPMPPSMTQADLAAMLGQVVDKQINGNLSHLQEGLDRLSADLRDMRKTGDDRHEQNTDRLARIEEHLGWDGHTERRSGRHQQRRT